MQKELIKYLKIITRGPLMAITIHQAVVDGQNWVSEERELWDALVRKVGWQDADRLIRKWIEKPYRLPRN